MTRAIGIDIGSTKIKIAEISVAKNREVVGLYEIERKADLSISDLIKDFFSVNSIQGERIAVGIGATPVMIRQNSYAFSNLKEIKSAIRSDLEDSLPFELDEYLIDEQMLWKRGKMRHFIVGLCPRERIDELNSTFEAAGVIPNSYLLDTQALAHLALDQCLPAGLSGEIYAAIDVGYSSTKLAVLRGSTPGGMKRKDIKSPPAEILELRVINRGLKDLVGWIAQKESISVEAALEWVKHRAEILNDGDAGESTESMKEVSDHIKTALRPLLVEIYQTFQAVKGSEDALPSLIYLSGPLTLLKGFVPFVAHELRVEAEVWDLFDGYSLTTLPAVNEEKLNSFGCALALAHRYSTLTPSGWLNFRRSSQAQKALITKGLKDIFNAETRAGWLTLAGVFGFALLYSGLGTWLAERERTNLSKNVAAEFRRMDPNLSTIGSRSATDLEKSITLFDREQKSRQRELRSASPRLPTDILLDVSEAVPTGYRVADFVVDKNRRDGTFRASLEPLENTAALKLPELKTALEQSLKSKGYSRISVENGGPTGRVLLKALWTGEVL
ncbi:MAG TPA: pilus assembly protein PilM [Bdellovibrionota bacterium]|nr:pilus assembly protein PilM [Bdellovibrionota bacterium]